MSQLCQTIEEQVTSQTWSLSLQQSLTLADLEGLLARWGNKGFIFDNLFVLFCLFLFVFFIFILRLWEICGSVEGGLLLEPGAFLLPREGGGGTGLPKEDQVMGNFWRNTNVFVKERLTQLLADCLDVLESPDTRALAQQVI